MSLADSEPVKHAQIFASNRNLTELFPFFQQAVFLIPRLHAHKVFLEMDEAALQVHKR
jgi:hypothetical protein